MTEQTQRDIKCSVCNATGQSDIETIYLTENGFTTYEPCNTCEGTGQIKENGS